MAEYQIFPSYLYRLKLVADGNTILTHATQLLPVRHRGVPMMLKRSQVEDTCRGAQLIEWWGGKASAHVFANEGPALLMERAGGPVSLAGMARSGRDDEACRILCAAQMRAPRTKPLPNLVPLAQWFRELEPVAAKYGGIPVRAAELDR